VNRNLPRRATRPPLRFLKRQGITLTEVVVGMVMIGTLLSGIIVGTSRLQRQQKSATEKLEAIRELDQIVSTFFREGFPYLGTTSNVPNHPNWVLDFQGTRSESLLTSTAKCRCSIAKSVVDADGTTRERTLASVELLVPLSSLGKRR
jgi:type II secretory pathway pseudopilin PulG